MENEVGSGPASSGQRSTVDIFVNALEKAAKAGRIYSYASGQNTLESIFDNTLQALERAFFDNETIDLEVKPFEILHEKRMAYQNKDRKTSLSFALYQDGIRLMVVKRGMTKDELKEIVNVLSTDFSKPEMMDEDLYCLFTERAFPHLSVVGGDVLAEAQEKNPELKGELDRFFQTVFQKTCEVKISAPRRLRNDDLKVLEEFRLNPAQFVRSDEDIAKVVRTLSASREGERKERETLERMLLMGFHFLINDQDGHQLSVGRELVAKVAIASLSSGLFDIFTAVIQKLYQIQKDRLDRAGEYQKIIDAVYHTDQLPIFSQFLGRSEYDAPLHKVLMMGPPSATRLIILLMGSDTRLAKPFADFIHRNLSSQMSWILETVQLEPQNEAWEQLIHIMSARPNLHFQKFLEAMLSGAQSAVRLKILRLLATIGSPDSLKIFEGMLSGSNAQDRMLTYDLLGQANSRSALKLLKAHMESEKFKNFEKDEKEAAFATVMRLGGELAFPWFESLWMAPGSGIFKKKIESERRLSLAKAILRSGPALLEKFLQKIPPETISEEIKVLMSKVNSQSNPRIKT